MGSRSGLINRLNSKIDVYAGQETLNELGEITLSYQKVKSVWAEITPANGSQMKGQGNTVYADCSHKFVARADAIPGLTNDMYFLFQGQRYDIKYFNPNYKYKDSVEIFCSLVVE